MVEQTRSNKPWMQVDLISDLHLRNEAPETLATFIHYLDGLESDALFILGDLFEVWIGDDFTDACVEAVESALRAFKGEKFFLRGNRDFLIGDQFLHACEMVRLEPISLQTLLGQSYLLAHGDMLCTADTSYLKARAIFDSPEWQQSFLSKTIPERQAIAADYRKKSAEHQQSGETVFSHSYAQGLSANLPSDGVNEALAKLWLQERGCATLIHGHTHFPADREMGQGLRRIVLSDWDCDAASLGADGSRRAEALRIKPAGILRIPL